MRKRKGLSDMPEKKISRRAFMKITTAATAGISFIPMSCSYPIRPNIILIYADDLGYGDVSCYGASGVHTPNIDKIAQDGIRFTQAYATAATCTPSRYSLLTGEYAFRKKGTGIAPGDAPLIIDPEKTTLPDVLKRAGYKTGVVGKWHLGLGGENLNWNGEIKPGPLELGFDYSFLIPATGDRVPCVYVENHYVVNLDENDPIQVSYQGKIKDEPTGISNPELLKQKADLQHSGTIVNGISRIGFMSGGTSARWIDEDIADTLTDKVVSFIEKNKANPFFMYFSLHDIHVPRVPHSRFVGKTNMGPRGDTIVQADWCVGEVLKKLDELNLTKNTIVIFTSDNGPVLNDGYEDQAVEKIGTHKVAGPLRGGKYSSFEGGTRVPFVVRWPGNINHGESDALISQIDLMASFAKLTGQILIENEGIDSINLLKVLLGKLDTGREYLVQQAMGGHLSLRTKEWKYIAPGKGEKFMESKGIETGRDTDDQLYNLKEDIGERKNVALDHPNITSEMKATLNKIKNLDNR